MKRVLQATIALLTAVLFALSLLPVDTLAQGSRAVSFLEVVPDARAAGMGLQSLLTTTENALYLNPSSVFSSSDSYSIAGNALIYPKSEYEEGRLWYGGFNASMKFEERHAILAGVRYQGGLKVPTFSDQSGVPDGELRPYDWGLDVGYALDISGGFSAFVTGTFLQSKLVDSGNAVAFDIGANYRTLLRWSDEPSVLNVTAKVANVGSKIAYSQEKEYSLPAYLALGSDLHFNLGMSHSLVLALGGRYFMVPPREQATQLSVGAEYTLRSLMSARVGYRYAPSGSSLYTGGLGFHYKGFSLDVAYMTGMKETTPDYLLTSISFNF